MAKSQAKHAAKIKEVMDKDANFLEREKKLLEHEKLLLESVS